MIPILKRLLHTRYLTPLAPALLQIDPMWDPIRETIPAFRNWPRKKTMKTKEVLRGI